MSLTAADMPVTTPVASSFLGVAVPPNLAELVTAAFDAARRSADVLFTSTEVAVVRVGSVPV